MEEQVSFLDGGFSVPEEAQQAFFPQLQLPQQVIDEALCMGLSIMLFSKEKMRYVTLNDSELRLAKYALLRFRNMLIAKELPTEDVNALLLKLYK